MRKTYLSCIILYRDQGIKLLILQLLHLRSTILLCAALVINNYTIITYLVVIVRATIPGECLPTSTDTHTTF